MINKENPDEEIEAISLTEVDRWVPSFHALNRSTSYENYLELMEQATRELRHEL
jgi:hypothetical protein